MTRLISSSRFADFLRDETGGEKDNINTLLILALIVLPLLLVLILFRNDVVEWFNDKKGSVIDEGQQGAEYQ